MKEYKNWRAGNKSGCMSFLCSVYLGKQWVKIISMLNNNYSEEVTGKLTKDMFGFLSIGGSCEEGSEACLALIQRESVMFASFSNRRKLFISAFNTSTSCFIFWFSTRASLALTSSSSTFFLFISLDRLAARLFFRLLSQYLASFFSAGTGFLLFLGGSSTSSSDPENWSLVVDEQRLLSLRGGVTECAKWSVSLQPARPFSAAIEEVGIIGSEWLWLAMGSWWLGLPRAECILPPDWCCMGIEEVGTSPHWGG